MEITEAAYDHIITRHMNGYENARWDSQFMDKLTKEQIFSICLRVLFSLTYFCEHFGYKFYYCQCYKVKACKAILFIHSHD